MQQLSWEGEFRGLLAAQKIIMLATGGVSVCKLDIRGDYDDDDE
jgi:hypothetical protein